MNIADERWETIEEFPNYMISTESRVMNKTTLKLISTHYNKRFKHRAIRLWNNGKTRILKLYRLKAIAFIPNPENKPQVNHIDGNRMNEDLSNMEWMSASENMKHSYDTGLCKGFFKKGLDSQNLKLSKDDVLLLRQWKKSGFYDFQKIGRVFNVCNQYADRVANGKVAKYV